MDFLNIDIEFLLRDVEGHNAKQRKRESIIRVWEVWKRVNARKIELVMLYDTNKPQAFREDYWFCVSLNSVRDKLMPRMKQLLRGFGKADYQSYVTKRYTLNLPIPEDKLAEPPDIFDSRLSTNAFLDAVKHWNWRMHYHKQEAGDAEEFLADVMAEGGTWEVSGIPSFLK